MYPVDNPERDLELHPEMTGLEILSNNSPGPLLREEGVTAWHIEG